MLLHERKYDLFLQFEFVSSFAEYTVMVEDCKCVFWGTTCKNELNNKLTYM